MLIFYDIIYILFTLCYLPLFLLRRKYHRGFLMRVGIFPQGVIAKLKGRRVVWLHTVSVGEAQAAGALVRNLRQGYPDYFLLISTVTRTGNEIAQRLIGPEGLVIYSPLDIGFVVRRVANLINPRLFIIAETEIWPNLIINLAKKGVAVVLVNGRISRNSFRGYKIIRPFLKKVFPRFSLFCMQTKEDAQRIISLGADEDKVKVTGNMKFDIQPTAHSPQSIDLGLKQNEQLFIAGSTHRGEEKIILQAYRELIGNHPALRLLIAPRHIERTQEIERLISGFGFKPQRVSEYISNEQRTTNNERPILILDTVGQLKDLYAFAEFVFIGGSLIRHGGQNPIEPAVFSKPILFGPYMSNFSNVARAFLNKKAAVTVKDARQLKNNCLRLLDNPVLRKELGERAKEVVRENKGATLKNTELIRRWINES
ncbi:MAG: 3-deoxy-D-manno-octulosonic acid transferase [Candidatus Omnitrophica bacterium]|nr:3-deoxy-D-manno-octulosonic acid transferase [Candidatus Omnitrophota bacterium]